MKQIALVLAIIIVATVSNATVIDVITDGIGSNGHSGTPGDPFDIGERVSIRIVLNHYPEPYGYPSYDGYLLRTLDIKLSVKGAYILGEESSGLRANIGLYLGDDLSGSDPNDPVVTPQGIERIKATTIRPDFPGCCPPIQGPTDLFWNIYLEYIGGCDGKQVNDRILLDLSINGTTLYAQYYDDFYEPYPGWIQAIEEDLGDVSNDPLTPVQPGDADGDWDVDDADLLAIAAAWLSSPGQTNWDTSADLSWCLDDMVNLDDVKVLAQNWQIGVPLPPSYTACWDCPTQCYGDSNCDGDVGILDLGLFQQNYGTSYPDFNYYPCTDFNRDGKIDMWDMDIIETYFGTLLFLLPSCPPGGTWPPLPYQI